MKNEIGCVICDRGEVRYGENDYLLFNSFWARSMLNRWSYLVCGGGRVRDYVGPPNHRL